MSAVITRRPATKGHPHRRIESKEIGGKPQFFGVAVDITDRKKGEARVLQKAVERMGGRVGMESVAGQGSKFWLQLQKVEP